jgi:hydantoinase/carbamoylase family amidase
MPELTFEHLGDITNQRFEELGTISDEPEWLTRAFGTPALRQAQEQVAAWMREAGMLVSRDAVGNLIGRYNAEPSATEPQTLVFGGHLDTVRNAGKYDGTLGVLSGLAVVEKLHAENRRLPYAVEVIAFADEESYRFPTMYLGSGVWTGTFDPAQLDATDANGVTLETTVREFGGSPDTLRSHLEQPRGIRAFIELHIEQGPVLEAIDSPIGIVTAIAGASRFTVDIEGVAGHAGTVPMHLRHDALVSAAECVLTINAIANETEDIVATVGSLYVTPNAKNVIPGHVRFTIDIRHQFDHIREDAVNRILQAIESIGATRGTEITVTPMPAGESTPMDSALIEIWRTILESEGITPQLLPSGAGHDAVAVAEIAPVSMLFLRCKGGISHNPAESITEADITTGIRILYRLLDRL